MKRASFIIACLIVSLTQAQNHQDSVSLHIAKQYAAWEKMKSDKQKREEDSVKSIENKRAEEVKKEQAEAYSKQVEEEKSAKKGEVELISFLEPAERLKKLNQKYGPVTGKKLYNGKVWIGMTDKMVIDEFGWADIRRARTASGVTETWFYLRSNPHCVGNGCPVLDYYLVFKNHSLIAIGDL